ncbi:MAG TPA: DUF4260 family protein [Miltoncostaeaceae bacterium]|nr:DUF4260 family protein [Miltoncostaeaceae bacterium]
MRVHLTAPRGRAARGALAAALLGSAIALAAATGATWPWVVAGAAGPDVALSLGIGRGLERGQLHPRAVPLDNALHHPAGPVTVLALCAAGVLGAGPAAGALAWGAHILMDRAAGYGLRTRDGLQRA